MLIIISSWWWLWLWLGVAAVGGTLKKERGKMLHCVWGGGAKLQVANFNMCKFLPSFFSFSSKLTNNDHHYKQHRPPLLAHTHTHSHKSDSGPQQVMVQQLKKHCFQWEQSILNKKSTPLQLTGSLVVCCFCWPFVSQLLLFLPILIIMIKACARVYFFGGKCNFFLAFLRT